MNEVLNLPTRKKNAFAWTFDKGHGILREGDALVLEMRSGNNGSTLFSSGLEQWQVRDMGFWNPRTVIEHNGQRIATLTRSFFGVKARVDLTEGRPYMCRLVNTPLVRLSFHNSGGVEVLNYRLDPRASTPSMFEVRNTWIPRGHLLLLIMLGCHAFRGIRQEHQLDSISDLPGAASG